MDKYYRVLRLVEGRVVDDGTVGRIAVPVFEDWGVQLLNSDDPVAQLNEQTYPTNKPLYELLLGPFDSSEQANGLELVHDVVPKDVQDWSMYDAKPVRTEHDVTFEDFKNDGRLAGGLLKEALTA